MNLGLPTPRVPLTRAIGYPPSSIACSRTLASFPSPGFRLERAEGLMRGDDRSCAGVAAEDIRVREGAGSEPLVTASTVPTVRPNNPSPNTELAAELSNGVPGFPAGDR